MLALLCDASSGQVPMDTSDEHTTSPYSHSADVGKVNIYSTATSIKGIQDQREVTTECMKN